MVPEGFNRAAPVQRLPQSVIQKVSGGIHGCLVMNGRIGSLRQRLSQRSVSVLAAASLPRTVRVAEVHVHICYVGQIAVPSHLFAAVICEHLAHVSDLI